MCYLQKESCSNLPCVYVIHETAFNRCSVNFKEEVTLLNAYSVIKPISKVDFYNFVKHFGEIIPMHPVKREMAEFYCFFSYKSS